MARESIRGSREGIRNHITTTSSLHFLQLHYSIIFQEALFPPHISIKMKFLAVLALAVGLASAADLCRTTGSQCSGNRVCCAGIQEGRCCTLNANKAFLVYTLPANR